MTDILNTQETLEVLRRLKTGDQKPLFGSMSAQHMVEHLALVLQFSNGKAPQQHHYPREKEEKIKAFVIGTDLDMPPGFKSPVLPVDDLVPLRHASLQEAINALLDEVTALQAYFLEHPGAKPVNPTMGELDYQEWVRFHNRHFAHHFKQFGLL